MSIFGPYEPQDSYLSSQTLPTSGPALPGPLRALESSGPSLSVRRLTRDDSSELLSDRVYASTTKRRLTPTLAPPTRVDLRSSKRGRGLQGEAFDTLAPSDESLPSSGSIKDSSTVSLPTALPADPVEDITERPVKPLRRSQAGKSPVKKPVERAQTTPTKSPSKSNSSSPSKTPRPPNAWLLYRSDQFKVIREDPVFSKKPQADISKLIAALWREERHEVKSWYETEADKRKKEHLQRNPGYKFSPNRSSGGGSGSKKKGKKAKIEEEDDYDELLEEPTPPMSAASSPSKPATRSFVAAAAAAPAPVPSTPAPGSPVETHTFRQPQPLSNFDFGIGPGVGLEEVTIPEHVTVPSVSNHMLWRSAPASSPLNMSVASSLNMSHSSSATSYDAMSPTIEHAESVAGSDFSGSAASSYPAPYADSYELGRSLSGQAYGTPPSTGRPQYSNSQLDAIFADLHPSTPMQSGYVPYPLEYHQSQQQQSQPANSMSYAQQMNAYAQQVQQPWQPVASSSSSQHRVPYYEDRSHLPSHWSGVL